jgi:hypothetical protein
MYILRTPILFYFIFVFFRINVFKLYLKYIIFHQKLLLYIFLLYETMKGDFAMSTLLL